MGCGGSDAGTWKSDFGLRVDVARWVREDKTLNDEGILERCVEEAAKAYEKRSGEVRPRADAQR